MKSMNDLPLKIGDTAYCIRSYKGAKHIQEGIVSELFYDSNSQLCATVKHIGRGPIGEKVFVSPEDAQAKLLEGLLE